MKLRDIIFWGHLTAGLIAGAIIFFMAATGTILAFEPQIVDYAERKVRHVAADPETPKLSTLALIRAHEKETGKTPSTVTLYSDPTASSVLRFGREKSLFVNPYTGEVLGKISKTHDFMHTVEDLHRWLGSKEIGRPITGAAALIFFCMLFSGLYLWWPKQWSKTRLKAALMFNFSLQGRAKYFNWHNVAGFWCLPLLFITVLTGIVMSYTWANDLLYRAAGSPPPVRQAAPPKKEEPKNAEKKSEAKEKEKPKEEKVFIPETSDAMVAKAVEAFPDWKSITLRFGKKSDAPVNATLIRTGDWNHDERSQFTFDPSTATLTKFEPYAELSRGARWRTWIKPIHTGEAAGILGQVLALLSSLAAAFLVWTGFSMSYRRFFKKEK